MGWGKLACWSTKVAISLKRVKIEEKLLWRAYEVTNALSHGSIPDPLWPPFPQDWGFATPTHNSNKATNFKLGRNIYRVHPNKSTLKFWRKGSVGTSRDCSNFLSTSIISRTGKATNFTFYTLIYRIDRD